MSRYDELKARLRWWGPYLETQLEQDVFDALAAIEELEARLAQLEQERLDRGPRPRDLMEPF